MKGIILAGGTGTRLFPITQGIPKPLLPVYDKPMIYHPLSMLMQAGIREILLITTADAQQNFKNVLEDGSAFGIEIQYAIEHEPKGIAQAFLIGETFVGNDSVCLALSDNVFWGQGLTPKLKNAVNRKEGATVFGYPVSDPERFGVVEFERGSQKAIGIEEKPKNPKSNYAVTGLYFYDNQVVEIAKNIEPSARGELEITTINQKYLEQNKLHVEQLGRGFAWFDAGTAESLLEASMFIETIEQRQGLKIACLEEIAWRNGWITAEQVEQTANYVSGTRYGNYLHALLKEEA